MIARNLLVGSVTLCLAGCGVAPAQLNDMEARVETKIAAAVAEIEKKIARTEQKINDTDAKYASMLALEQQVKNGVERIDKHAKLLADSGEAWAEILQTQENVLREQLKSVEDQIAGLKPADWRGSARPVSATERGSDRK